VEGDDIKEHPMMSFVELKARFKLNDTITKNLLKCKKKRKKARQRATQRVFVHR
jgi:hypothetical protein